jgi:hypothetical protein
MAAAVSITKGEPIGLNAGFARRLNTGDTFAGHALRTSNNSAGAAGAKRVPRQTGTYYFLATVAGAITQASIGTSVRWNPATPGYELTTGVICGVIADVDVDGKTLIRCEPTV